MEPLRFTMDFQWIPSHFRMFFCVSSEFRALRSLYVARHGVPTFQHEFTVGSPISFLHIYGVSGYLSLDFLLMSHVGFARLLVILWYCLMSFVYCTTISWTTNKHKKRILHKEKTSRHKSIKFCLFVFFLHVKFSLSMYYACSSFAYLSFTKVRLLALVIVNQKAKKPYLFGLLLQYTLYSAGKRSFPCFEFVVQPH